MKLFALWTALILYFSLPVLWAWGHNNRPRDALRDVALYWSLLIGPAAVLGVISLAVQWVSQL